MVYSEKFVAVVVCDGKILREKRVDGEDVVKMPFNSEYSIKLKNLNSVRALVSVEVDGKDVLDGKNLIIDANEDFDLKGFLKGYEATNAFKFIKKTQEISDHRGDKIDDGFIRITYQFEKQPEIQKTVIHENHHYRDYYHDRYDYWWNKRWYGPPIGSSDITYGSSMGYKNSAFDEASASDTKSLSSSRARGSSVGGTSCDVPMASSSCFSKGIGSPLRSQSLLMPDMAPVVDQEDSLGLDEGITVKGERVNQQFKYGSVGALEEAKQVIVIRLKGTDKKNEVIKKAVFVNTKITCDVCGKKCESNTRFCPRCGNCVEI